MPCNEVNGAMPEGEIIIDYEKLEKVREEIINNCSVVLKHKLNCSSDLENRRHIGTIKNITRGKFVECKPGRDGSADINIYEYTYDEYISPNIIKIIDEIISGNEQKIQSLFNTDDLDTNINGYRDIDGLRAVIKLIEKFIRINDKAILEEAKYLIMKYEYVEVINPKSSVKEYYLELQECFSRNTSLDDLSDVKTNYSFIYRRFNRKY